jgi:hypothetical protein
LSDVNLTLREKEQDRLLTKIDPAYRIQG